jgi:hypothetical protein
VTRWITCVLELGDHKVELDAPRHWTPIFFLDEAVALAAGHRPCAYCRRDAYRSYRDAVADASGAGRPVSASDLDRLLVAERLTPGRGVERGRRTWRGRFGDLPVGSVVLCDGTPWLVGADDVRAFGFGGWSAGVARPPAGTEVDVLTPPTSVAALTHGFVPVLHPTAR